MRKGHVGGFIADGFRTNELCMLGTDLNLKRWDDIVSALERERVTGAGVRIESVQE